MAVKRIARDVAAMIKPEVRKEGIYFKMLNDKLDCFYMMLVGPDDTPYEGALFFFTVEPGLSYHSKSIEMKEKQYPFNPPRVLFHCPYSIRIHPNLYKDGKVCLSILGTWPGPSWSGMMTFMTIAQTILSLLDNEPLRNEPGFVTGHNKQVKDFTTYCSYVCLRETIEKIIIPALKSTKTPDSEPKRFTEIFAEELLDLALSRRDKYIALLNKRAALFDDQTISGGGIWRDISYVDKKYDYKFWANSLLNAGL